MQLQIGDVIYVGVIMKHSLVSLLAPEWLKSLRLNFMFYTF